MSLYAQPLLDVHDELIVDLFAGGGGASSGIEQALGRPVDIAINHNPTAIALHEANHPQTRHYVADVFEVEPKIATQGRPVGLLWASPDCTYHSKARGKKPIRSASKKRRALAWVVTRWAGQVRPRVIKLENVEEFQWWGPLIGSRDDLRPCKKRRGKTFKAWVRSLRVLGYSVEWRELRACDYGAPTIRKRLYLIARCDGQPIEWPAPTHGHPTSQAVQSKVLQPWRAVAKCIDWSLPMCSIFATPEEAKEWAKFHGVSTPIRPLRPNTMARIARGVQRFVLDNPKPFLVPVAHGEGSGKTKRWGSGMRSIDDPHTTATCKGDTGLVVPFVAGVGGRQGQSAERSVSNPLQTVTAKADSVVAAACLSTYYGGAQGEARGQEVVDPLRTQSCENRHALTMAFLGQNNGGYYEGAGRELDEPCPTILANSRGHFGLTAAHIQRDFGTSTGHPVDQPVGTITSDGGGKAALVYTFLSQYNGTAVGQTPDEPVKTISTTDRYGLVSVNVYGEPMVIVDIAMRMLAPKELYKAQGFRSGYIIDRGADGKPITKSEQVRMVGNSVCPPVAEALVRANCADMIVRTPQRKKA